MSSTSTTRITGGCDAAVHCSLHHAGHSPASEGPEVRLRCASIRDAVSRATRSGGEITTEIPLYPGQRLVTAARLESSLGGEVTLTLTWAKPESFVLAQGASATTGMKSGCSEPATKRPHPGHGTRRDASNYAVNLNQTEPFDPGALEQAGASACRRRPFVSEVEPAAEMVPAAGRAFRSTHSRRSRARSATKDYPRAWLARGG